MRWIHCITVTLGPSFLQVKCQSSCKCSKCFFLAIPAFAIFLVLGKTDCASVGEDALLGLCWCRLGGVVKFQCSFQTKIQSAIEPAQSPFYRRCSAISSSVIKCDFFPFAPLFHKFWLIYVWKYFNYTEKLKIIKLKQYHNYECNHVTPSPAETSLKMFCVMTAYINV